MMELGGTTSHAWKKRRLEKDVSTSTGFDDPK
jgi:hypothetical protein